jgi:hypothetical protein
MAKATIRTDDEAPAPTPTEGEDLTTGLPPEDYHTEQFKSGPNPSDPPVDPVPAVPIDVGAQEPYPSGNPPPDPFHNPDGGTP